MKTVEATASTQTNNTVHLYFPIYETSLPMAPLKSFALAPAIIIP